MARPIKSTPDQWFPSELQRLLMEASDEGLPLPALVSVLFEVMAVLAQDLPPEHRLELLVRFAQRLNVDMEVSVEPKTRTIYPSAN